jgi:hypothetical protein
MPSCRSGRVGVSSSVCLRSFSFSSLARRREPLGLVAVRARASPPPVGMRCNKCPIASAQASTLAMSFSVSAYCFIWLISPTNFVPFETSERSQ